MTISKWGINDHLRGVLKMTKINKEEYEVLKNLDDKWRWIARDRSRDRLTAYMHEPTRSMISHQWLESRFIDLDNTFFQFIQWEDEPYNIAELIEEYEEHEFYDYVGWEYCESEETEVKKNIEWLKSAIQQNLDFYNDNDEEWQMAKVRAYAKSLDLINQLDEPEVLSQEWIGEHTWNNHYIGRPFVYVDDLENLIVPKQELPVIPKFVAEAIEEDKECGYDVYESIDLIIGTNGGGLPSISDWVARNIDKYASAWLNGFTVEEEPLYRARLKVITDEFIASYLRTQSSDAEDRLKALEIGSKYIHEDYRHLSEFTEDELKILDIWDSEQWEVEELEE